MTEISSKVLANDFKAMIVKIMITPPFNGTTVSLRATLNDKLEL